MVPVFSGAPRGVRLVAVASLLAACGVDYGVGGSMETPSVCWDLNSNRQSDPAEDVNGDGSWDVGDCQGPEGEPGAPGPQGATGPQGSEGPAGASGLPCWDLDGDGVVSPGEDVNEDGVVDVADCRGARGTSGRDGTDGADGRDGVDGVDGADGRDGISCWDADGDGVEDPGEDTNGDGVWDAADCGGGGGGAGLTKDAIYQVVGSGGPTSTATCATVEDVLITGGCEAVGMNCLPVTYTSEPRGNDDLSIAASWYCSANCGTVTATAFCLAVPP